MHITVYLEKLEHLIYFFYFVSSALLFDWTISEKRSLACGFQDGRSDLWLQTEEHEQLPV